MTPPIKQEPTRESRELVEQIILGEGWVKGGVYNTSFNALVTRGAHLLDTMMLKRALTEHHDTCRTAYENGYEDGCHYDHNGELVRCERGRYLELQLASRD